MMKNCDLKFQDKGFFDQSGQILITVIIILAVMLLLVGALSSNSLFSTRTNKDLYKINIAYNIAEAGINKALKCLNTSSGPCSETGTEPFGQDNGKFTTTVATSTAVDGTIESTGTYYGIIRKIKVDITTTLQSVNIPFNHTIFSTGTTTVGNNSTMTGDTSYTSGNISCGTGVSMTGTAVGAISGCPAGVTSTTIQIAKPDIDIEYWKQQAAFGGTQGATTTSGTSSIGPKEIIGDLTLGNSSTTTIAGVVYVHGALAINNDAVINLDNRFGSATGTVMLSRGKITIGNNVKLLNSTPGGSLLLVSLSQDSPTIYAVDVSNNIAFNKVIMYAPNGTIDIKNNASASNTVRLVGKIINIGNNTSTTTLSSTGMLNNFTAESDTTKWRVKDKTWREIK